MSLKRKEVVWSVKMAERDLSLSRWPTALKVQLLTETSATLPLRTTPYLFGDRASPGPCRSEGYHVPCRGGRGGEGWWRGWASGG